LNELLIERADFDLYRPLAPTLDFATQFEPIILRVQRGWLRDVLGPALYRDLHTNPDGTANAALLGGDSFTLNGQTVDYFGLKGAIVCYTYAQYIKQNDMRVTRAGNKRKRTAESENAANENINAEYQKAMGEAVMYLSNALQYLLANASTYPLWVGAKLPRGGVRVGVAPQHSFYTENNEEYYGRNY
jgi:hypothetical protein